MVKNKNDGLGDRIKKYESVYNNKFPIRLPLIIRLDGVHFHTQVKKWKCEKPFDDKLINAMYQTALYLCKNISGAKIAYIQSDEITILIRDDQSLNTEPWFNKEINKIMSVSSAMASNAFNSNYFKEMPTDISLLAMFDCRGFIVPEYDIYNTFLWRQRDCERNSIQMLARSLFSHKELHNKNTSDLHEMLHTKGVNWNDLDTHLKRGACISKNTIQNRKIPNQEMGSVESLTWGIDYEIPIFSEDPMYIQIYQRN